MKSLSLRLIIMLVAIPVAFILTETSRSFRVSQHARNFIFATPSTGPDHPDHSTTITAVNAVRTENAAASGGTSLGILPILVSPAVFS